MAGIEDFTDEYFQRSRAELAKPFSSVGAPVKIQDSSFVQNVWDEVTVQPFWNMLSQSLDVFEKYDPEYEPLSKQNIKGYEQYTNVLRESRNAAHGAAIKARIDRFRETKERIDEEGGLLSGFASELFNPINYLLPGSSLVRGVGLARGFVRGVAAGAPSQLVDEALRQRVDPTATLMESGSNLAYGLVFTGLIGSGVGFMKAPDIDGIAQKYRQDIDRHMGIKTQFEQGIDAGVDLFARQNELEKQLEEARNPKQRSAIRKEIDQINKQIQQRSVEIEMPITPTAKIAEEPAKIAEPKTMESGPATGIYRLPEKLKGILRINAYGDLITSGVGLWESFGHRVLGEHDIVLNKNVIDKLPTEASLYLGNGLNEGPAIVYRETLQSVFGEYLGGSMDQMTVAGLNIPVTARRMTDALRGVVGSRASDGLMTYPEFKDMIYRSLRDDGTIVVPDKRVDGTVITDREKKAIERGAQATADLYRNLGERFIKTGYLRTKQSALKQLDTFKSAMAEHQDRLIGLYSIQYPTAKQLAEIEVREEALKVIGDKITEMNTFGIKDEDFYEERIKGIASARLLKKEAVKEKTDKWLNKSKSKLEELEYDIANRRMMLEFELETLLGLPPEKVTSSHLRRMSYLEKKLESGITEKQQNFLDSLRRDIADLTKQQEVPYTKKQIKYLYYMFEKQEELAQIRKDIDEGVISYERLRENYVPIIYNLDAILADEAGDKIFRKKIKAKFVQDSESNSFYREKKELAYEFGLDEAITDVWYARNADDAQGMKKLYEKIDQLEKEQNALRNALSPEEIKAIGMEQSRIRRVVNQRMTEIESKLTKEEINQYRKNQGFIDDTILETRLAILIGMKKLQEMPADELSAKIDDAINKRVDGAMNNILRQGELGELSVGASNGASFMAKRKLGFSPHEIADFTITDLDALSISYSKRGGMSSQLTGAFGSRDAVIGIYRALADGINEIKENDFEQIMTQINKAKNSMFDVRDYALGDQWVKDVTAWDRKAVRAILDWSTTTNLDNAVVPSIADAVRPITTFGLMRTMEFAFKGLFSDLDNIKAMKGELGRITGEFGEVSGAAAAHTYVNGGGVSSVGTNWATKSLDKFSGFANGPFFILNGLSILTETLKRWTGLMSSHFLIEDAIKIATGKADEQTKINWRAASLSDEDASKIAKLVEDGVIERPNYGYYANTGKWNDDELINRFAVAVRTEIRRTIVTSGPANKPTAAQGFIGQGENRKEIALARLPFQLMSWAFAANNKIMLSALQGRDANMFATVLTLIGMGGIVSYLTTPENIWEKLPLEEKVLRSVERSGVFGIFTDMSAMVETATRGHYGIRPMVGMDPPYGQVDGYRQFSRIAGAPTSNFVDLYKVFVDQDLTDRERAKAVINMIPLTGAFYWKEGWQQLGRSAADAWD